MTEAAAIVGAVGVAAALGSLALPALGVVATVTALLVLAAPTLAGHALDPHRLRGLVALADFVHVLAAAVWIGGLVLLVLVRSPRAGRRFRAVAAGSVAVLGAAAIPRALAAFPSLSSVVDTSYGRAVLVKTGLLVVVLALGWSNRRRLARVGFLGELVVLAGIVGTVAVLTTSAPRTQRRCGRARRRRRTHRRVTHSCSRSRTTTSGSPWPPRRGAATSPRR